MPICKPSATSACTASVLLAIGMAPSLPAAAAAQQAASNRQAAGAHEAIEKQGDAAMERLKDAVAKRKEDGVSAPAVLPELPETERRRAFEAMRHHTPSPAMQARARSALDAGKDAFAGQREAMAKRLRQALGLDAPDMAAISAAAASDAAKAWVPVLFVSSSMPTSTLRTYAAQLEKASGVMAFRGMPGGLTRVGPMAKLSAEILRLDPGCDGPACAMRGVQLIVDPLVFRQHAVNRVPALAMIPGDPVQPYCERDETSLRASHVVYGDAALTGLLDEYARLGGKEEVQGAQARLEGR